MTSLTRPLCILIKGTHFLRGNPHGIQGEPTNGVNFQHSILLCEHCENSNVYSTLIMKCPKCFWHDNYKISLICDHQIPEERNYIKEGFLRCHIVEQLHTKTPRRWKPIFSHLLKKRTRKRTNFHPFQIAVYLTLFVTGKVFKTVSRGRVKIELHKGIAFSKRSSGR